MPGSRFAPSRLAMASSDRGPCATSEASGRPGSSSLPRTPREDWNDQWYERLTTQLFNRVWAFAEGAFGHKLSSPPESRRRPWSEPFSPQFVHIVSQIARKDDNVGGWDHVLLDGPERCYLAMGIIAKVLDEHVFSELVFGDSETNKKLWSALDESHMSEEGWWLPGPRRPQTEANTSATVKATVARACGRAR